MYERVNVPRERADWSLNVVKVGRRLGEGGSRLFPVTLITSTCTDNYTGLHRFAHEIEAWQRPECAN
jgi:hypothetical protein